MADEDLCESDILLKKIYYGMVAAAAVGHVVNEEKKIQKKLNSTWNYGTSCMRVSSRATVQYLEAVCLRVRVAPFFRGSSGWRLLRLQRLLRLLHRCHHLLDMSSGVLDWLKKKPPNAAPNAVAAFVTGATLSVKDSNTAGTTRAINIEPPKRALAQIAHCDPGTYFKQL
jgi:hypothetical protein